SRNHQPSPCRGRHTRRHPVPAAPSDRRSPRVTTVAPPPLSGQPIPVHVAVDWAVGAGGLWVVADGVDARPAGALAVGVPVRPVESPAHSVTSSPGVRVVTHDQLLLLRSRGPVGASPLSVRP